MAWKVRAYPQHSPQIVPRLVCTSKQLRQAKSNGRVLLASAILLGWTTDAVGSNQLNPIEVFGSASHETSQKYSPEADDVNQVVTQKIAVSSEEERKEVIKKMFEKDFTEEEQEEVDRIIKELYAQHRGLSGSRNWACNKDLNDDGDFTVSDVSLWIPCVFFYPGDSLIYNFLLEESRQATFFELTPESYGGTFSFVVSFVFWAVVVFVIFALIFVLLLMAVLFHDWWENRKLSKKGNNGQYVDE